MTDVFFLKQYNNTYKYKYRQHMYITQTFTICPNTIQLTYNNIKLTDLVIVIKGR